MDSKTASVFTFTSSQHPHDIEHPVPSFPEAAAPAATVATDATGGGVSGGEGRAVTAGAGIPGFSITSMRLASYQDKQKKSTVILTQDKLDHDTLVIIQTI